MPFSVPDLIGYDAILKDKPEFDALNPRETGQEICSLQIS